MINIVCVSVEFLFFFQSYNLNDNKMLDCKVFAANRGEEICPRLERRGENRMIVQVKHMMLFAEFVFLLKRKNLFHFVN